jgi:nickel-dependent lactate racemase
MVYSYKEDQKVIVPEKPIQIPWGHDQKLKIDLPAGWKVIAESEEIAPESIGDLASVIRKSLEEPVGLPSLRELAGPDTRIALVMDDMGRPTPMDRLAPVVLDYLLEAGARPENITGLFAVGTHEVMSAGQMEARAGSTVFNKIKCLNFECRDTGAFVRLGETGRGTPVIFNRMAVEADLRVLIGTIEAHPQAGFGGGFKNLLPGLATAESIGPNHLLMPSPERYNMIGTLPEDNPMRLDLEEAGRMIDGPTFIINTVLDHKLEPVAVIAGDAVEAHRAGVEICRGIYGVEIPRQADVVISSAYPMDQELRQAGKGVLNVAGACKPGGVILGFMRCEQGLGNISMPGFTPPLSMVRAIVKMMGSRGILGLVKRLPKRVPVEARFLVNFGLQMLKDYHVLIYSPRLKEVTHGRFPPILYDDQEELFRDAGRIVGKAEPEVAVFLQGSVSFPVFPY